MDLVFIALSLIVLLVLIHLISRRTGLNRVYYAKRWQQVETIVKTPDIGPKMAVIEADKILDMALKQSKFKGKTMGERLVAAEKSIRNYQDVWDAHKLRNRLVHEEVKLKKSHATSALGSYKTALKHLGAL